jgi:hypothetical protein
MSEIMSAPCPQPPSNPSRRSNPWNARGLLPYSRRAELSKLDQRTREARLMRETRAELVQHCGGRPSVTQSALIEQLVQIKLRLCVMDRKFAETGAQTDHDSRVYLAWTNSFARLLRQLGLQAAPAPRQSLADRLLRAASHPDGPRRSSEPPGPVQRLAIMTPAEEV